MGNNSSRRDMIVGSITDIDDNMVINQGTTDMRQPQLAFHTIHGANIALQKGGRLAKRNESFCKGLVFSNRPIGIDENVCIKQCEVATNWSGVLRFGVTNIDPETYRNTAVPKFACPDLTSKEGYWAKALPERFSVEGNILHFYVTMDGELYYGINGQQKGLFLMGINTGLPLWVIIDIYGNSQAVEFIDANEHRTSRDRSARNHVVPPPLSIPTRPPITTTSPARDNHTNGETSGASSSRVSSALSFHRIVGRHITLSSNRTVATRQEHEYSHGYVFTDRPVANNEKITIQITKVLDVYHGGLAVGLTCRDPSTLRGMELPADSSDLVNFPDMFVGIKDVANKPALNTKLSFWVTDKAELKMQIGERDPRTLIFVDNSLQLYFYFDVYGSTQAIKLIGASPIIRSRSPQSFSNPSTSRLSDAAIPTHVALPTRTISNVSTSGLSDSFNASIRLDSTGGYSVSSTSSPSASSSSTRPPLPTRRDHSIIEDLLTGPSSPSISYIFGSPSNRTSVPPPLTPRPAPPPPTPPSPFSSRPPAPPPVSSIPAPPPRPSTVSSFTAPPPCVAPPPKPAMPIPRPSSSSNGGTDGGDEEESEECTVCMAAPINSVIYTCGHMCMCYTCALQTKELGRGCPICRKPMQDVIRIFKT